MQKFVVFFIGLVLESFKNPQGLRNTQVAIQINLIRCMHKKALTEFSDLPAVNVKKITE